MWAVLNVVIDLIETKPGGQWSDNFADICPDDPDNPKIILFYSF